MGKSKRKWIQLDFSADGALRAQDIPYDSTASIKTKIDSIGTGGGSITVKEADGDPIVTDVRTIEFDQATGLYVTDLGSSTVKISSGIVGGSITIPFTNSDMVGNIFTVNHGLGSQYINCMVYDNLEQSLVSGPTITLIDTNSLTVDLEPYLPLTGTWHIVLTTGTHDYRTKISSTDNAGYLGTKTSGSITSDSTSLLLVNDSSAPGTTKYYGTDGSGVKGFHSVPAGGPSNTIAGISNPGGDISIIGGTNVTITPNDATNFIQIDVSVPQTGITVQDSDGTPSYNNVTTLQFDQATGLEITSIADSTAKVSIGSHWKNLVINGQNTLIPHGQETLEFISGHNISLVTDSTSTPKSITINSTLNDLAGVNSIVTDSTTVQLIGDADVPGNTKYYGTNSMGSKGFYTFPPGGPCNTISGVSNVGGDINILSGGNVTVTPNDSSNTIEVSLDLQNITTNVTPNTNSSHSLGTTLKHWQNGYVDNLYYGSSNRPYYNADNLAQWTGEPTGFANQTDSSIGFDSTSHIFTITGTSFKIYIKGVEYTKSTESISFSNTTGLQFFYYDTTGSLSVTTTFPGFDSCFIAALYWNATIQKGLLGEERHGCVLDSASHKYLHNTIGTRYVSGLAGTFANTTFSITNGVIFDEDIELDISTTTTCPVLYKNGSADYQWNNSSALYYYTSGGNIYYNNGNVLTASANNDYIAYWIFATNDLSHPIVSLMGQRVDSNLTNAQNNNKYESLSLGTLPFKEMKLLYRVILKNAASPYIETQDLRSVSNVPSGTYVATDHATLTGLTTGNAGHTQFVMSVTGTSPISSSGGVNPDISIASATTSAAGAVQLSNLYNGTSQTLAVTEKALSDGFAAKGGASVTLDGISNQGGNIDLVGGPFVTISPDSTAKTITFSVSESTSTTFSNTDLSSSTYTFIHNSGHKHTPITIYDNTDKEIIPDEITATDSTSSLIDLTSFAPISGTWRAVAVFGAGGSTPTYTVDLTNVATDIRPTVDNNFNIGSSTKKFNSLYVGTIYSNVTTITGVTTLSTAHDIVLCNSASAFTVTLPACSGVTNKQYRIKNINTGTVTVDGSGSETIDGSTTVDLFQYESITIVTNGSNWFII